MTRRAEDGALRDVAKDLEFTQPARIVAASIHDRAIGAQPLPSKKAKRTNHTRQARACAGTNWLFGPFCSVRVAGQSLLPSDCSLELVGRIARPLMSLQLIPRLRVSLLRSYPTRLPPGHDAKFHESRFDRYRLPREAIASAVETAHGVMT
jgi:hypothetical protein